jgi:RNA polymerase sigma-70 factor (family 1)
MNSKDLQQLADHELLALLKEGNREAFDAIYTRFSERLYFYLVKAIKDSDEAEDILQEVFYSLWKRRYTLENIESICAYLFSCVRYSGIRYIRNNIKKNHYRESWNHFFCEEDDLFEQQFAAKELSDILYKEIDKLPPKMREVFVLSRKEEFSYKEIAQKLNISDKTVKKQISNALKHLHLKLNGKVLISVLLLLIGLS